MNQTVCGVARLDEKSGPIWQPWRRRRTVCGGGRSAEDSHFLFPPPPPPPPPHHQHAHNSPCTRRRAASSRAARETFSESARQPASRGATNASSSPLMRVIYLFGVDLFLRVFLCARNTGCILRGLMYRGILNSSISSAFYFILLKMYLQSILQRHIPPVLRCRGIGYTRNVLCWYSASLLKTFTRRTD